MILRATKNDETGVEEHPARQIGAPETRVEPRLTKKDRSPPDEPRAQAPRRKLIIERREPEPAARSATHGEKKPERARTERKGFSVRAKIAPPRSKSAPTERKTPVTPDNRRPSFGKDGTQRDGEQPAADGRAGAAEAILRSAWAAARDLHQRAAEQ